MVEKIKYYLLHRSCSNNS